jgi:hypothetical protein
MAAPNKCTQNGTSSSDNKNKVAAAAAPSAVEECLFHREGRNSGLLGPNPLGAGTLELRSRRSHVPETRPQELLHIPDAGKRSLIRFLQDHLQSEGGDGNSTREADNVKESPRRGRLPSLKS